MIDLDAIRARLATRPVSAHLRPDWHDVAALLAIIDAADALAEAARRVRMGLEALEPHILVIGPMHTDLRDTLAAYRRARGAPNSSKEKP